MEKIISGGLLYDTITVKVVDDPQERNAIVYYNLVWFRSDIYGSGSQEVSLPKPDWLDLSDHPIEVYVQFDSTSAWVFAD